MDMFNLVFNKFKEVHFRQEQNRIYPVYGMIEENGNSQVSVFNSSFDELMGTSQAISYIQPNIAKFAAKNFPIHLL